MRLSTVNTRKYFSIVMNIIPSQKLRSEPKLVTLFVERIIKNHCHRIPRTWQLHRNANDRNGSDHPEHCPLICLLMEIKFHWRKIYVITHGKTSFFMLSGHCSVVCYSNEHVGRDKGNNSFTVFNVRVWRGSKVHFWRSFGHAPLDILMILNNIHGQNFLLYCDASWINN